MNLKKFEPGDKVTYIPTGQKGIVKAGAKNTGGLITVVFECQEDWSNYSRYRGDAFSPERLSHGWPKEETSGIVQ